MKLPSLRGLAYTGTAIAALGGLADKDANAQSYEAEKMYNAFLEEARLQHVRENQAAFMMKAKTLFGHTEPETTFEGDVLNLQREMQEYPSVHTEDELLFHLDSAVPIYRRASIQELTRRIVAEVSETNMPLTWKEKLTVPDGASAELRHSLLKLQKIVEFQEMVLRLNGMHLPDSPGFQSLEPIPFLSAFSEINDVSHGHFDVSEYLKHSRENGYPLPSIVLPEPGESIWELLVKNKEQMHMYPWWNRIRVSPDAERRIDSVAYQGAVCGTLEVNDDDAILTILSDPNIMIFAKKSHGITIEAGENEAVFMAKVARRKNLEDIHIEYPENYFFERLRAKDIRRMTVPMDIKAHPVLGHTIDDLSKESTASLGGYHSKFISLFERDGRYVIRHVMQLKGADAMLHVGEDPAMYYSAYTDSQGVNVPEYCTKHTKHIDIKHNTLTWEMEYESLPSGLHVHMPVYTYCLEHQCVLQFDMEQAASL